MASVCVSGDEDLVVVERNRDCAHIPVEIIV